MTPYYERAGITIYHADCRDVLPDLSADAVLTDPPYGVGKASWDGTFDAEWMGAAANVVPVLAVMPGVANLLRCPSEVGPLVYRWTLAAHVANGMTRGAFGFGNWIPCLVYAAPGSSLYQRANDVARVAVRGGDKPDHPTPKPLDAIRFFLSRLPGNSVVDPFMGSGTTLIAAREAGRGAIGIEIEERYCEIAAKRLEALATAEAAD